jgi:hypothetical protein
VAVIILEVLVGRTLVRYSPTHWKVKELLEHCSAWLDPVFVTAIRELMSVEE